MSHLPFNLRTFLHLDVAASGAVGLLLLVLAGPAESELGLPVAFSVIAGTGILAWAAFVAWVAAHPSPALVKEVVALNVVYVVGSLAVAIEDWATLTGLGTIIVVAQGLAVLGLTIGQYAGLRAEARAGERVPVAA